jgi:hypothetical protein
MRCDLALRLCASLALLAFAGCSDDGLSPVDRGSGDATARDGAPADGPVRDGALADGPVRDHAPGDRAATEGAPGDGATGDARWKDTGGAFPCGASRICSAGQYCQSQAPGRCGGNPVPDSGTCPPDCRPTSCPGGHYVCLCIGYQCLKLPAGCGDCACLKKHAGPGCACTSKYGGLYLDCPGA